MEKQKYTFFWKGKNPFSQWYGQWLSTEDHKCDGSFVIDNVMYLTAEHYMMAEKARLFNDLEKCQQILESFHPGEAKQFGREVKDFNLEIWEQNCKDIVFKGNYAKFTQHSEHKEFLIDTKGTLLIEASPNDLIWGIGLTEKKAKEMNPSEWPGKNYLGEILTKVRDEIIADEIYILEEQHISLKEEKNIHIRESNYEKAAYSRDIEVSIMKRLDYLKN